MHQITMNCSSMWPAAAELARMPPEAMHEVKAGLCFRTSRRRVLPWVSDTIFCT